MDKKKKDDVDYAAAYRQFMNFGNCSKTIAEKIVTTQHPLAKKSR